MGRRVEAAAEPFRQRLRRMNPRPVIGLTGPNAAGKGAVAEFLRGRGFRVVSLSDVVREEAARRGLAAERDHLIAVGNELRRTEGPDVLARRILPRLEPPAVVDSIRSPAEVEALRRALPEFVLLGVVAPTKVRFERARRRGRPGDPQDLASFVAKEEKENTDDPMRQQLQATLSLADYLVENSGDLDALHAQLEDLLTRLERAGG